MTHMTGFPVTSLTTVGGQATHRAMNGQSVWSGRSLHTAHAVDPRGSAHQRNPGSTTNGTNSAKATGG